MLKCIQYQHGGGEDAHAGDVGSGGESSGNDENHQDCVTDVAPHPSGADYAHQGEEENQNRHFENEAQAQNYRQEKIGVLVNRDHGQELSAHMNEEIQGLGIDDAVSEIATSREQENGGEQERADVTLLAAIKAWRDEQPDLVEHIRRSKEQASEDGNLQVEVEGFGGVQIHQLLRQLVVAQNIDDGPLHVSDQGLVIPPGNPGTDCNRDQGMENPLAELVEVLEEAHGGHGFLVGAFGVQLGGGVRHWWCRGRGDLQPRCGRRARVNFRVGEKFPAERFLRRRGGCR